MEMNEERVEVVCRLLGIKDITSFEVLFGPIYYTAGSILYRDSTEHVIEKTHSVDSAYRLNSEEKNALGLAISQNKSLKWIDSFFSILATLYPVSYTYLHGSVEN